VPDAVTEVVRQEGARVLATLVRVVGDLQLAEDAVQDAVLRAVQTWPARGVPDNPRAWLTSTARNRAVDLIRREALRSGKEADAVRLIDIRRDRGGDGEGDEPGSAVRDDLLRLIFTCAHPALALPAQVALCLRTLGGLSTAEVARALLVPEATMTKRLTRTRQKIKAAGIPYRVPRDEDLPQRLTGVAATVYLIFNEGYAAGAGADLVRTGLVDTAIRLARLLVELMPDEPATLGLLALLLLQDSRRTTRTGPDGRALLLAEQDRSRWDRRRIVEGVTLVGAGLRRSALRPDRYVVQAAIAACHALAPGYADTDWAAVLSWYDVLLTLQDTPVVRLNRAAAVAELSGPAAGLALTDELTELSGYPWWHATRAELLRRLDRPAQAADAARRALALDLNASSARRLRERHGLDPV
jgi:RNA polymerase sigma-70 factor (ECF subfamily)